MYTTVNMIHYGKLKTCVSHSDLVKLVRAPLIHFCLLSAESFLSALVDSKHYNFVTFY